MDDADLACGVGIDPRDALIISDDAAHLRAHRILAEGQQPGDQDDEQEQQAEIDGRARRRRRDHRAGQPVALRVDRLLAE
jgi:hypothetical protein